MDNCHTTAGIPDLQGLAFEVFYRNLVCKLRPDTVKFTKDCIDRQLIGTMRKKIREKCISKFNECCQKNIGPIPDICLFLNSILDISFLKLKIFIPFQFFKSFDAVMSTIAMCSPDLEELHIHFELHSSDDRVDTSFMLLCANKSSPFHELKSLTLSSTTLGCHIKPIWVHPSTEVDVLSSSSSASSSSSSVKQSFLAIIGKWCPKLVRLKVADFRLRKEDLLGLMVGELAHILFPTCGDFDFAAQRHIFLPIRQEYCEFVQVIDEDAHAWCHQSVIERLLVPSQFLSPLCLTLEELHLNWVCLLCDDNLNPNDLHSTFAFALRHLPKLRIFDAGKMCNEVVAKGIEALQSAGTLQLSDFEVACEEAAELIGLERNSSLPSTVFPGLLSLTQLDVSLALSDASTFLAIGKMCPLLEHVRLTTKIGHATSRANAYDCSLDFNWNPFKDDGDDLISPEELESAFHEWPKVSAITLEDLSTEYARPVLNALGPHLKKLTLKRCEFDMAWLSTCTQLQHLKINCCSLRTDKLATKGHNNWTYVTFLPVLTEFFSNICLKKWAPIFEEKSTLVKLTLNCCHIATKAYSPHLEWIRVPELWPQLESLECRQCTGLTIDRLPELLPKMSQLKSIRIPDSILQNVPNELPNNN